MPQESTVSDLNRMLEEITESPTTGLKLISEQLGFIDTRVAIFKDRAPYSSGQVLTFVLDDSMTVFIEFLTGKTTKLRLQPQDTVFKCKQYVEELEGIPIDQLRLIKTPKQLEDGGSLQ